MPFEVRILAKGFVSAADVSDGVAGLKSIPAEEKIRRVRVAMNYLDRIQKMPGTVVEVATLAEYFDVSNEPLRAFGGLDREIEDMETFQPPRRPIAVARAGDTKLAQEIANYEAQVLKAVRQSALDPNAPPYVDYLLSKLEKASFRDLRAVGGLLWGFNTFAKDDLLLVGVAKFEASIARSFDTMRRDGLSLAGSGNKEGNPLKTIVESLFGFYAEDLAAKWKKNMLNDVIDDPSKLRTAESKLSLMIDNSGPFFKKFTQVLAQNEGLDPKFREVLEKQESNGRAMPPALVKRILDADPEKVKYLSFDWTPLAVGSMAQVHRATIIDPKTSAERKVVVRVMHADGEEFLRMDQAIFNRIAPKIDGMKEMIETKTPKLAGVIEDMTQNIVTELDVEGTAQRQLRGGKAYTRTVRLKAGSVVKEVEFRVPEIFRTRTDSRILIQEMVEGGKAKALSPEMQKVGAEQLAEMYMDEVLFKDGFFHGDPHFGNVIVKAEGDKLIINLIDYGMGGSLTPQQQRSFIKLAIGAQFKNQKIIVAELMNLSVKEKNKISEAELRTAIKALVDETNAGKLPIDVGNLMAYSMESGIKIPADIVGFARGEKALGQMLDAAGEQGKLGSIVSKLALKNPKRIFFSLVGKATEDFFEAIMRLGKR